MGPRERIWKHRLRFWLHTRSIPLTRTIARRYGNEFGFVYVGGYPKSGTTWMSLLVADYLDLPCPRESALPLAFTCVVHHHWRHEPALDRSIYVVRDGRDVMVSEFFNMMRGIEALRERAAGFGKLSLTEKALLRTGRDARLVRRLERVLGKKFDPWDVERNLPRFIEANMTRPWSEVVPDPWPQHVARWLDGAEHTVFVRYEELLRDGEAILARALAELLGREVDAERVREVLRRRSFERVSGRRPGEEDRSSTMRKGITGDWRNHFTSEATRTFDRNAGAVLVRLGYERSREWVDERPR